MLPRRLLAPVLMAALCAPPASARAADSPPPVGRPCAFLVTDNVTVDGERVGQVNGGPLVVPGFDVSMRCSIHVGNDTHSGAAAASASTGAAPNVAVLAPTPVWYAADPYDVEYLCTEATVGDTTWYWTGGTWSTDPASPCEPSCTIYDECVFELLNDVYALGDYLPPPAREIVWDPVFGYVGCSWYGWYCPVFDWVLCATFQYLQPGVPGVVDIREDGDVYVAGVWFWDCPPYGQW